MANSQWDMWVEDALKVLASRKLIRELRPVGLRPSVGPVETFEGLRSWDRSSVEVEVEEKHVVEGIDAKADVGSCGPIEKLGNSKKKILFSGNDYLGLTTHPSVCKAAVEASQKCGMGPRGSALICGYTSYHSLLESSLADLKKKEDCLLCPTGYAANLGVISSLGRLTTLTSNKTRPSKEERVAIFSDALNHASIIDGLHIVQQRKEAEVFVYRHCDCDNLNSLLGNCEMERKVVITDGLFSMDGDFAPILELIKLRKKYGFLLVVDDAHGTFVCGENGGGVAELFGCENDIDLCIGTLSKAAGCLGGFVACSKTWKLLMQSTSRSFIFSTALPVPVAAAAYASVVVSKKEKWRRKAIWDRVREFSEMTKIPITSPIVSVVLGSEESALRASRYMLRCGFHVIAVRPPSVPPNTCRLRLTLSAAHTGEDIKKLASALLRCIRAEVSKL